MIQSFLLGTFRQDLKNLKGFCLLTITILDYDIRENNANCIL